MEIKRLLPVALVGLMLLAGCTEKNKKNESSKEIGGTLTVVTSRTDGEKQFEKMEKEFKEKYPKVTDIKWEAVGEYDQTMLTRMSGGDYGDVLFVPFTLAGTPEEYPNYFESLGKVSEMKENYLDVTEADFDEEVYGLPVALNSLGIIYNEKVFAEAGITETPKTVEEFIAVATKIKEKTGAIPFYTNYQRVAVWAGALTSFGGEQFKSGTLKAGNAFKEGQPIREVMDLFYALASKGLIEADPVTFDFQRAQTELAEGKIGMLMNGSQEVAGIQKLASEKDVIKMMDFPVTINGKTSLPLGAPAVIGVNKNSGNKETAKAFLEFFISGESGYANDLNGMTPVLADLSEDQQKTIEASHVILTVATEKAEDEALYNGIADEVGISRLTDVLQQVINTGLYPDQYSAYDDYVNQLETSWNQAVKSHEK